jgi:hypothetical protein
MISKAFTVTLQVASGDNMHRDHGPPNRQTALKLGASLNFEVWSLKFLWCLACHAEAKRRRVFGVCSSLPFPVQSLLKATA